MTDILSNRAAIYSALTDFAGCVFYILLMKKRMGRWQRRTALLMAVTAEICFLVMTPGLPYGWQIPASLATAARWLLYICYNGRDGIGQMIYRFIKGFVFAEIIAFMQWQMYSFLNGYGTMMPLWQKAGYLAINLVFYSMMAMMEIWQFPGRRGWKARALEILPFAAICAIVILAGKQEVFLRSFSPGDVEMTELSPGRLALDFAGVAVLYLYSLFYNEQKARREIEMVETLMQKQYQQYQMAKESIDIINRKYHDFKHQIEVLRSAQDFDIRNQYLDQLEEDISAYEAQNRTGCAVLDTILTSKSIACAGKHIKFTKVVDGSLISFMDTMDICSIFGNALENAIEYAETIDREKRLIHLSVSGQKEFVLIQVENYFEGELRFQDALPVTGKADKAFHGYGMKSMRSTAEKYGGSMTSAVNGTWFEVRILLPVPEGKTESGKQPG